MSFPLADLEQLSALIAKSAMHALHAAIAKCQQVVESFRIRQDFTVAVGHREGICFNSIGYIISWYCTSASPCLCSQRIQVHGSGMTSNLNNRQRPKRGQPPNVRSPWYSLFILLNYSHSQPTSKHFIIAIIFKTTSLVITTGRHAHTLHIQDVLFSGVEL